ncbi:S41 family peptidase [Intestinimonas butyriciproducens]|uniref:S41 family peptidase n=1 Tax=Intestinimonas butyriciproducens TaxID=1297617 RepID=UPI0019581747|nr:S41 family peptidase [Intestinimonas butyriciproducens]MBM6975233.1 S-layer homology domain-containing protein [Intestinimonas butyriciproducens]
MKIKLPVRAAALTLTLTLALSPVAGAITVDEAREMLREFYIDEIPEEILSLPTIDEITTALGDPYTYYMTAEEYASFQNELNGANVVGIGVAVENTADGLLVTSVAPDSPGAKAGLKAGDLIVAADGVTVQEAGSANALAGLVAGEEGTQVTITLIREEQELSLTMTREPVVFPTVTGEVVDDHIGWLHCSSFGTDTGEDFRTYIQAEDEAADRWVVDLRGNPGGSATAVIQAVGHVLGSRNVAYVVDRQGNVAVWRPNPLQVAGDGLIQEPLVVLVDGNSASAAELFTAAMRDYSYGLIIGTRTFGKGIAQNVFEQSDGSAFKITTERYYSPGYVTPDRSGVLPHLVVEAGLADEVARLLCGAEAEASENVLALQLAGRTWYVHREEAVSEDYAPAFAQLLSAIAPNTPMTLNGRAVTPAEASQAWGVDYQSRWFDDVDTSPYGDEINALAALGVLLGNETGEFNPQGQLTRGELVSMMVQGMGYWCWQSQGTAPFTDVSREDWYATVVDIAYNLGLIQGNEDGEFRADDPVDHQQFLTILARMGARADLSIQQKLEQVTEEETASEAVQAYEPWARAAVAAAKDLGFLAVPLEELDPSTATTREEAAAMLYRMLDYIGTITPVTGE